VLRDANGGLLIGEPAAGGRPGAFVGLLTDVPHDEQKRAVSGNDVPQLMQNMAPTSRYRSKVTASPGEAADDGRRLAGARRSAR
jgi:hypothetical protein